MDSRIEAIMARLDAGGSVANKDNASAITESSGTPTTKPPQTFEEFMKAERLNEWPQRLTSEGLLDVEQDRALLGNQDDMYTQLKEATPVDMHFLQQLESRLEDLTGRLELFADKIVVPPVRDTMDKVSSCGKGDSFGGELVPLTLELSSLTESERQTTEESLQKPNVNKAFLTDLLDSDMLKVHPSRKGKRTSNFKESLIETKRRGVENCIFPGFRPKELTELPGQLEAPQILNRVTKAQDFNPGFKKFWKKIFQSEASVAVMQDSFWWIFLRRFEKKQPDTENKLFDRIADSFVALFTSINPEVKDKFFQVYSDCLAQALCAAYYEAFPESQRHFQDDFKQVLINTISEWVSGIRPSPGGWKKWRLERLEPKVNKAAEGEKPGAVQSLLDTSGPRKDGKYSLEIDDFMRLVNKLGETGSGSSRVGTGLAPTSSREVSKLPSMSSLVPVGSLNAQLTVSRQAQCGTPRRQPVESHCIGPGPDIERVLFNLKGQSPLVAHYLHMRQLRDKPTLGRRVRRTQVSKSKSETTTYRQLINETQIYSEKLSKEYQKICEQTSAEIAKIERHQREINADIDRLKRDLITNKNPTDLKIITERILDKREQSLSRVKGTNQIKMTQSVEDDHFGDDAPDV